MIDDNLHGTRNKRGDWKPLKGLSYPPVFVWPARPVAFVKWLFGWGGYILPWNLVFGALSAVIWLFLTPSMGTTQTLAVGWIAYLLGRNALIVLLWFGAFHLPLYMKRRQGTAFKYNGRWPSKNNSAFLFSNQNVDNVIWTFASAVPIWTAYEVLTLWAFANDVIPYVSFAEHPIYCALLFLVVPIFNEVHFYIIHRLIHIPFLYRAIHRFHHNNVNPGPWSGLAMHPVEHLLYFSTVLIHWIIPSHPVHALFNLTRAGIAPAIGHSGFDQMVVGEDRSIHLGDMNHYLHHKHFECNYADGVVPIDKWFGTFHDGSDDAEKRMNERFMQRARKHAAKKP
jgi:sterol desaturase/sphingolipid hydroxylase (fatty acid hydroxylase superfamily)